MLQVAQTLIQPDPPALRVKTLLLPANAAELSPRLPACFFVAQAFAPQFLGLQLNVRLQLFSEIIRAASPPEHTHASSGFVAEPASRISPTACVSRRHWFAFSANCSRPRSVSE